MLTWFNGDFFITALAEWIACVIFISNPPKRLQRSKAILVSVGMFFVQTFIIWMTTNQPDIAFTVSLPVQCLKACLYLVVMSIHIWMVCRVSLRTACVLGCFAFLSAELAWGFSLYGHYLVLYNGGTLTAVVRWGIVAGVFLVLFGILFLIERYFYAKAGQSAATAGELVFTVILTLFCYLLSYLYLVFIGQNWSDLWDSTLGTIPRWTYVLVGLFILYVRKLWKGYLQIRHELEMINGVFEKQKGQYEQAMVNAEVVNQQYHDLKNQIAIMKADISTRQQEQWLEKLEKRVEEIEPERLTGHPVLDTILWEKNQYCKLHGIRLSYVMDGGLFDEVAAEDLCVLFGGALDNAIEAVMKLEDPERRLIHVKAMEQQGYIVICVENINDTPLKYKDGVLVSSKEDQAHHGYGVKGIRYIAEKYGGSMSISQENHWLRLTVLFRKDHS